MILISWVRQKPHNYRHSFVQVEYSFEKVKLNNLVKETTKELNKTKASDCVCLISLHVLTIRLILIKLCTEVDDSLVE